MVRYWPLHELEFLVRQSRKGSSSLMNSLGWLRLALGSSLPSHWFHAAYPLG